MKTYHSKVFSLKKDIDQAYTLLSNPTNLKPFADKYGDKINLKDLTLTSDALSFSLPGVGPVVFRLAETEAPNYIKYKSEKSPVPMALSVNLSKHQEKTDAQLSLDVEVPAFMSGMVETVVKPLLDKVSGAAAELGE